MITANIASSGPNYRHSERNRDSFTSVDLKDLVEERDNLENQQQNGIGTGENQITEDQMLAMQEEAKRLRQLISEHRRKKCCKDYKTWAYMICVASILIGTIVLIILAGMGIVKVN